MDTKPALLHYPSLYDYLIPSVINRFMETIVFIAEDCVLQVTRVPEVIWISFYNSRKKTLRSVCRKLTHQMCKITTSVVSTAYICVYIYSQTHKTKRMSAKSFF